jgi:hypothetical protein
MGPGKKRSSGGIATRKCYMSCDSQIEAHVKMEMFQED